MGPALSFSVKVGGMHPVCQSYEGKKITMLGLGLLGRAAGDAEFFAKCGAEVIVTDTKDKADLVSSVARLQHYPNIAFHLGGHRKDDFTHCDMVVKAAGVKLDSPEVAAAKAAGVAVVMSTSLFAKHAIEAGATIVGVTGTRGKSTITHLIYHALVHAGRKARLGGNVRGVSTLAMLPEVVAGEIDVLELDSWQLQGFGELKISPHVAVFSNFMEDHLNYYPSMEAYFEDKANIFRYQRSGDVLIVGGGIEARIKAARPPIEALVPPAIPRGWKLRIKGEHNRENASLAAATLRALGLSDEDIRAGLTSFEGVEGRLQFLREVRLPAQEAGVKIYNDNNATTPAATLAALAALGRDSTSLTSSVGHIKKNILLIMGGADKGIDMRELIEEIPRVCKKVFLLAGSGSDRIKGDLPQAEVFDSIESATAAAVKSAEAGDVILFSPAFASFGIFKNEYDRNDRFAKAVGDL